MVVELDPATVMRCDATSFHRYTPGAADRTDDTCIPKFDEISFAAAAALRPVVFPSVLRRSCFRTITGLIAMLEHPMHTATMQISHC